MSAEPPDGSYVSDLTTIEEVGAKIVASPSCGDMAIDVGVPPGPERTRALLAEIAGGRRGAQLRGQVAAVKRGATREQIEEAFQEACLKAGRSCRGQTMGEVYKWLLKTTDSTVDDMRDRLKREVLVDHSAKEFQTVDPSLAPPDEVLIKREERAELDELTLAILERLDEREREVAVLHSHGLARNEIARHLGITARIVKRDVEGILATGREQLTRVVGSGCPDGHKLVSRYAFGLAAGREARRAQLHLATCARCGAMYERLDLWRERVAALVPMPPAVEGQHARRRARPARRNRHRGVASCASSEARRGCANRSPERWRMCASRPARAYYRTVDPTPLVGRAARRGRGGGRRLSCRRWRCDLLRAAERRPDHRFTGLAGTAHHEHKPEATPRRARAAQVPTTPVVTPTVTAAPPDADADADGADATTAQAPATTATTSAPPPAPEDQFEPTSPGATSQPPAQASTSKPKQPAPAPAGGPGEFDGP